MTSTPRHDDDVGSLPGVHAGHRKSLTRMGIETLGDLLRLAPRRYEDRRHPVPVSALQDGVSALVIGRVVSSRSFRTRARLSILEAQVEDESGIATARWFYRGFRPAPLPVERRVALYGVAIVKGKRRPEFKSPELERLPDEDVEGPGVGRFVPVHPRTSGITTTTIRRAVWNALPAARSVPDPLPEALRREVGLPDLGATLAALHFPDSLEEAELVRRRLAFDELLIHELLLAQRRGTRRAERAPQIAFSPRVHERIRERLPFRLTQGQDAVVAEIVRDLEEPGPMYRLLQGDVGSGKTAVAAYAMLGAVAAGHQCVFMAPTEVLARQHAETLAGLLKGSRVRLALLVGGLGAAERRAVLAQIASGEANLIIGTHAVLSAAMRPASLGLVVVDEQHKFGVRQRRDLVAKGMQKGVAGQRPHCLVMTATPIPRTLALTVWGDMDVSVLRGRLPGRSAVETLVVRPRDGRSVMERVRAELATGRQAYVIYPLVEESEKLALRDAQAGLEAWTKALPGYRVGLLHGRLKRAEKEHVMEQFRRAAVQVLVATVVVEVGVDVPNATVLVVEHAERFGLSQLHQLRGRIGRGQQAGLCVLVDRSKADDTPPRLEVLAGSSDGFAIAEEDLKLRGLGDLFGTRQHGRAPFRAASLPRDLPVLEQARRVARRLASEDLALERPEHSLLAEAVCARNRHLEEDSEQ